MMPLGVTNQNAIVPQKVRLLLVVKNAWQMSEVMHVSWSWMQTTAVTPALF